MKKIYVTVAVCVSAVVTVVLGVMYLQNLRRIHPEFLYNAEWSRYSEELGESLEITFEKNGGYSYSCECGRHSVASDKYERYSYNKRFDRIELSKGHIVKSVDLLYFDKHTLCLLFDDGVHTFENKKDPMGLEVTESIKSRVDDVNAPHLTVLGLNGGRLTVAPYNYDGDSVKLFEDYIRELPVADGLKCISVDVRIENGAEQVEVQELNDEDKEYIGEYYTGGFLKFNEYGEVSEIIFFGITEVYM